MSRFRAVAIVMLLAAGCAEEGSEAYDGPWIKVRSSARNELGVLREASCVDLGGGRMHVRIVVDYRAHGADDGGYRVLASFDAQRAILDGGSHVASGWIDVAAGTYTTDPDFTDATFTPDGDHDAAIERAIAYPVSFGYAPDSPGRFHVTATLRLAEPCPSGDVHLFFEGDGIPEAPIELFAPIAPEDP